MKACDLEEKNNHLQACVAIDLGARYTGTFSILHKSSHLPSKDDCRAATYVLPEDGGKMTYSQRNRTAVRHRIRGKKRFALARRMAMLIIREKLAAKSVTLTSSETRRLAEAVGSLLRRRGYNRLETETDNDLTVLENIEPEVFSEHEILGKYFYAGTDLAIQWETLSQDLSKISSLLAERLSEKDFKKYLTGLIPDDKNKIKHIISVFKMLIDEAESINMQCVLSDTSTALSTFPTFMPTCIGTPVCRRLLRLSAAWTACGGFWATSRIFSFAPIAGISTLPTSLTIRHLNRPDCRRRWYAHSSIFIARKASNPVHRPNS